MFYNYDDMQFSVGGNNNGVITLTTPTLTPTTMRNIEQSILDSTPYVENHEEAGSFIPPLPTCINLVTSNWQGGSISTKQEPVETYEEDLKVQSKKTKGGGKMGKGNKNGGRRPRMDKNISPEEEERRRLRRERNKLAAARCRKRRVDHTNSLVEETQCLESKKNRLQDQITRLQQEREELEFILSAHNPNCTKGNNNGNNNNNSGSAQSNNSGSVAGVGVGVGPTLNNNLNNSNNLNHVVGNMKPKRPTSLPVAVVKQESLVTPSTGLDLDWSTLPSTGLTPNFTPITPSVNLLSLMDEDPKSSNKKNNLVQL